MLLFILGLIIVVLILGLGIAAKIAVWALVIGLVVGGGLLLAGAIGGRRGRW